MALIDPLIGEKMKNFKSKNPTQNEDFFEINPSDFNIDMDSTFIKSNKIFEFLSKKMGKQDPELKMFEKSKQIQTFREILEQFRNPSKSKKSNNSEKSENPENISKFQDNHRNPRTSKNQTNQRNPRHP